MTSRFACIAPTFFALSMATFCAAQGPTIAVALVPVVETDGGVLPANTFTIQDSGGKTRSAILTFDPPPIPRKLKLSVVLQLVLAEPSTSVQQVLIFDAAAPSASIAQIGIAPQVSGTVVSTGLNLSGAVQRAVDAGKPLRLLLRTGSIRSVERFYTARDTPGHSPRLIVSWLDPSPAQIRNGQELRYQGGRTDASPWRYDKPDSVVVSKILGTLNFARISGGPAFHGDEILLSANTRGADAQLYGLGWNGSLRWTYATRGIPWKYLVVDDAENRIVAFAGQKTIGWFDWSNSNGSPTTSNTTTIEGMSLSSSPALNPGGVITYLNDNGYVYAFSPLPKLRPLWQSTSLGKEVPSVTLSTYGGDGLLYFFGNENGSKGFYAVDPVRGTTLFPTNDKQPFPHGSTLGNFDHLRKPVVAAAGGHDWVYLASSGNNSGVLEGYGNFRASTPSTWREAKPGAIAGCVAAPLESAPQILYCIQNDQLNAYKLDGSAYCSTPFPQGVSASNLILDGNNNVYVFNRQTMFGFDTKCNKMFAEKVNLPVSTEGTANFNLRIGPNGVLYAASVQDLYAIQFTVKQWPDVLKANTRYVMYGNVQRSGVKLDAAASGPIALAAMGGSLTLADTTVPAKADLAISASDRIVLGPGFVVEQGAILRCSYEPPPQ